MYAVIKTGGQQFRVEQGMTLKVEKLEVEIGKSITFDDILMVADGDKVQIGAPTVAKASVEAKIIAQGKGKKVHILKFRRRKHSMKQQGHRQLFTEIEITKIKA
ncbi:MAG: 50S ribosomal protein L21 [Gammaproteobacteria bacterium]|uniref:Large ribosomal subunit protein bL21 n=1 Tax=endosymbiont of Bathymodiolus septemdierum str. Myojin knoll TaxID=1303921 RepID=A0A0P0UT14_9GAMM|nr:50S ribosomal protein L21 [Bathymodiolus septemdierum thioautotrophic gill symbiont]RUA06057.1 MAG: 50S ribosomal protein L21 [Gammaproteobacteria bacterium]BAS68278.1 large subunit ribosomal protein L21 [endosymbiont of Bathymodiolus septemdierum str. Myojin knoll]